MTTATAPKTFTPTQMLLFLVSQFVTGNTPPAINSEGEPVYELCKGGRCKTGCFAYTVAKANPKIIDSLRKFVTHARANIKQMLGEGVTITDILDAPDWDENRKADFMQELQDVHDRTARAYYDNKQEMPEDMALAIFRGAFGKGLVEVADDYNVSWTSPVLRKVSRRSN